MEEKKFNQFEYQNKYIKEKYDRVNLTLQRGKKEAIQKKAAKLKMSVNGYINSLIDEDLKNQKENL